MYGRLQVELLTTMGVQVLRVALINVVREWGALFSDKSIFVDVHSGTKDKGSEKCLDSGIRFSLQEFSFGGQSCLTFHDLSCRGQEFLKFFGERTFPVNEDGSFVDDRLHGGGASACPVNGCRNVHFMGQVISSRCEGNVK